MPTSQVRRPEEFLSDKYVINLNKLTHKFERGVAKLYIGGHFYLQDVWENICRVRTGNIQSLSLNGYRLQGSHAGEQIFKNFKNFQL